MILERELIDVLGLASHGMLIIYISVVVEDSYTKARLIGCIVGNWPWACRQVVEIRTWSSFEQRNLRS
jgi:hypothetical protein